MCRSRTGKAEKETIQYTTNVVTDLEVSESEGDQDGSPYALFNVSDQHPKNNPIWVSVKLNDKECQMQVDTGASVSLMSENTYQKLWSCPPKLDPSKMRLHTHTGEEIQVLGSLVLDVSHNRQQADLPILVVSSNCPLLLGRDWLRTLILDWKEIKVIHSDGSDLQNLLDHHVAVFRPELGSIKEVEVPWIPHMLPTNPSVRVSRDVGVTLTVLV